MCSVALLRRGETKQRAEIGNNIHSKVLLSMVQELLNESRLSVRELDAVAVGQGPGSFTGLRIGVGVAQGLAYGAVCPMVGVSSLRALAMAAPNNESQILAGIDARMGEVYWAEFARESGNLLQKNSMQVSQPERLVSKSQSFVLVGNAWTEYWSRFAEPIKQRGRLIGDLLYPQAQHVAILAGQKFQAGETIEAMDFAPIYVRDDVAKKSSKPLPGRRA